MSIFIPLLLEIQRLYWPFLSCSQTSAVLWSAADVSPWGTRVTTPQMISGVFWKDTGAFCQFSSKHTSIVVCLVPLTALSLPAFAEGYLSLFHCGQWSFHCRQLKQYNPPPLVSTNSVALLVAMFRSQSGAHICPGHPIFFLYLCCC